MEIESKTATDTYLHQIKSLSNLEHNPHFLLETLFIPCPPMGSAFPHLHVLIIFPSNVISSTKSPLIYQMEELTPFLKNFYHFLHRLYYLSIHLLPTFCS